MAPGQWAVDTTPIAPIRFYPDEKPDRVSKTGYVSRPPNSAVETAARVARREVNCGTMGGTLGPDSRHCICRNRHHPRRSSIVMRSEQIRMTCPRGGPVGAGSGDHSVNSARRASGAMKSIPLRSMIKTAQPRTSLRAYGLRCSMSDASTSPLIVITVRSASLRIHRQGLRPSMTVAAH